MKSLLVGYAAFFMLSSFASAQSTIIDKAKLMEYFQNQQFDEAIGYLSPAITNDSADIELLGFLGYASYMNENTAAAKKYYLKITALDSNNITGNHYLAMLFYSDNTMLAMQCLRRLISLQPGKALYSRNIAELFKKINQKDSALQYYRQAYTLSPNDYKNAVGLAAVLIEKELYAAADSILDNALNRDSLNIACLKLRIRSAYEAKDYQYTLQPGEKLMRQEEISLSALSQLALSYYNLKMYPDCIRVCDFMLQHDLDIESVYYYQAKGYAKIKDFNKSNELLQICLTKAISKTAEMYYYMLGENYGSLHQYAKAVKQYDSAYYLFKSPLMKYYGGSTYETGLKDEKLAGKYYRQYLQLAKPASAEEKKAYEYVKSKWGKKSIRKK